MRLRARLSLSFLAVVALGAMATFLLVGPATESVFRSFIYRGDSEKAKVYADLLGEYYLERGSWEGAQAFLTGLPDLLSSALDTRLHGERESLPLAGYPAASLRALMADRVALADARGVIVADTAGLLLGTEHPAMHLAHGLPVIVDFRTVGTVLAGSLVDSSLSGLEERYLASVTGALLGATALSAALALLLGLALARRITRPLAALSAAARRVASGEAAGALAVSGSDEVADLQASFNEMTAELRRLDEARRQVIADSAHELRTPLTLIQGTVEAMLDGILPLDRNGLQTIHEESLRLARLIDTLRELERIESGELALDLEVLDLGAVLARAAERFGPQAAGLGITLEVGPQPRDAALLLARADPLRLDEVVYNLLANALRHAPSGGRILLVPATGPGGFRGFSVEDSGPGVAPAERERIFDRFYRVDKSRSAASGGRGLGLAIAREIVAAHGGSIGVGDSALGGASFLVLLPPP